METVTSDKKKLEDAAARFDDAFNREDLDAVMAMFQEDAIYDQFNGIIARGKVAIREALVPQFRGDHGRMRFHREDRFVDVESRRVAMQYRCTHEINGKVYAWRGIDTLHFEGGLVKEKHTYSKAEMPLLDLKPDAEPAS